MTLIRPYTLGYIRLFGQEEEVAKREVQTITLRSRSALGGTFTLNVTDALGESYSTGKQGALRGIHMMIVFEESFFSPPVDELGNIHINHAPRAPFLSTATCMHGRCRSRASSHV